MTIPCPVNSLPFDISEPLARDTDTAVGALRQHPLFAQLESSDFEQILFRSRRIRLAPRELLYHQNETARSFYFVASGVLRLYRLDATGVDRTLDSLGSGDCLAEVMIYAEPAQYACYAESLSQTLVLSIPLSAYRQVVRRNPSYAEKALCHLAGKAVSRFHDLEVMTVQNARERLIRYLLDLLPGNIQGRCEVTLPLPKYQVASRLAMQPETLSRFLNELKRLGMIHVDRNRLTISDPEQLRQLCHA